MIVPAAPRTHLTEDTVVSSALTTSLPVQRTASDPGPTTEQLVETATTTPPTHLAALLTLSCPMTMPHDVLPVTHVSDISATTFPC